jgi:G:T-mismatch repair DNA endonuclease (very short patch repair protein)
MIGTTSCIHKQLENAMRLSGEEFQRTETHLKGRPRIVMGDKIPDTTEGLDVE